MYMPGGTSLAVLFVAVLF